MYSMEIIFFLLVLQAECYSRTVLEHFVRYFVRQSSFLSLPRCFKKIFASENAIFSEVVLQGFFLLDRGLSYFVRYFVRQDMD